MTTGEDCSQTLTMMLSKVNSELEEKTSEYTPKRRHPNPFVKKDLRQTMQDLTIHGSQQMADQDRLIWSRAVWVLGVLSSFAIFVSMFVELLSSYYLYPYKTVIESTPTETIEFPAISICNLNTLDVSNVPYAKPLRDVMAKTAFIGTDGLQNITDEQWQVLNMSAQTILEDTDPGVDGIMGSCFYNGSMLTCNEVFDVNYWAMTRCYTLNASLLHSASATTTFRVVLSINQQGYVAQEDKSAGVKFFVHEEGTLPNLDAKASKASPGFSTDVGLIYQKMIMLNYPYKSYGQRYCTKTEDIDISGLPIDGLYRLRTCLQNRAVERAVDRCMCTPPFKANTTWPECTFHQMLTCVLPELDVVKKNMFNASDELGCPLPCEYLFYTTSISFSTFPSYISQGILRDQGLLKTSDVSGNYLELNFYFSELIRHVTTHVPEYTPLSIMGTMGGNLGFFLGASILSCGEIIELLVTLGVLVFRRLVSILGGQRSSRNGRQGSKTP